MLLAAHECVCVLSSSSIEDLLFFDQSLGVVSLELDFPGYFTGCLPLLEGSVVLNQKLLDSSFPL